MPVKNCGSTSLTFKQRPFSKFATCSHHAICCSCLGLCAYWISQHRETKRLIFAQWSQKQLVLYPEWIFTTFQWRTNDFVFFGVPICTYCIRGTCWHVRKHHHPWTPRMDMACHSWKWRSSRRRTSFFHFSDYWQVDEHRREFLRHRRDPRTRLHDVRKSKIPLPLENLKPEKETHTGVQERWQEGILQGSLETWEDHREGNVRNLAKAEMGVVSVYWAH